MHARDKKSKDENGKAKHAKIRNGNREQPQKHQRNIRLAEAIESINNMHIWTITNWEKNIDDNRKRRTGIRFRYDKAVDPEVKRACTQFAQWLRTEYYFPLRVLVYVKKNKTIRAKDGENVVGIFFEPVSYSDEPHIRIATGDYEELKNKIGKDNALATILATLAHELTHYYQWINGIQLTPIGRERQASRYSDYILYEYSLKWAHP